MQSSRLLTSVLSLLFSGRPKTTIEARPFSTRALLRKAVLTASLTIDLIFDIGCVPFEKPWLDATFDLAASAKDLVEVLTFKIEPAFETESEGGERGESRSPEMSRSILFSIQLRLNCVVFDATDDVEGVDDTVTGAVTESEIQVGQ
jgi:hypothetical protein